MRTKSRKGSGQAFHSAWTSECEEIFEALKLRLTTAPVLAYADFAQPFILETDASHSGLGAVLSQETENGVRPIVLYMPVEGLNPQSAIWLIIAP